MPLRRVSTGEAEVPAAKKDEPTDKSLNALWAQFRKLRYRVEKQFGVDLDDDSVIGEPPDDEGSSRLWAVVAAGIIVAGGIAFATDIAVWRANEAQDATIVLDADQGDDTADTWSIESEAADNDLSFVNGTTEMFKIPAAGAANQGTAATGVSLSTSYGDVVNKTILTFSALTITNDGSSGVGFGAKKIYDFPEAGIQVLGVIADGLSITMDATLADTDGGDFSFGSTATADATLTGTDANFGATASWDPFSGAVDHALVTAFGLDGSDAAVDLYLNLTIDDADVDGITTNTISGGTVTISWVNLGDN